MTPAAPSAAHVPQPAVQGLFTRLIDDAAVFPPGLAPLDRAVTEHLSRSRYAGLVGPLLVPATAAGDVGRLAASSGSAIPLRVALVVRPGDATDPVRAGVDLLRDVAAVEVSGIEIGWSPSWRELLDLEVPVTVEIPRAGYDAVLADIARASRTPAVHVVPAVQVVQAKFRTGATDTWTWPDEDELARFFHGCVEHGVAFKLTGGLHHAVRGEHGAGAATDPQHGLLNVLLAVHRAVEGGTTGELGFVLAERDPGTLASAAAKLTGAEVSAVRGVFTAYGCCSVSDPIDELAALGLLEHDLDEE